MFDSIKSWFGGFTFDRSEDYTPIGRKILKVIKGKNANHFKKRIASVAHCIGRRGGVPDRIVEGEEGLFPYFEIAVNPQKRYSQNVSTRDIKFKAKESILKLEDTEIIRCLHAAVRSHQTINVSGGHLTDSDVNTASAFMETHNVKPDKILVHPMQYADIRQFKDFKKGWFPRLSHKLFGHSGKLWGMKIFVSHRVCIGEAYVLPKNEFLGLLAIRQDIKCLKSNDTKNLRDGWVLFEDIGICIVNDYALSKIHIYSEHEEKIERKKLEFFKRIEDCSEKEMRNLIRCDDKQLVNFITKYNQMDVYGISSKGKSFTTDIQAACEGLDKTNETPAFIMLSAGSMDHLAGEVMKGKFGYTYKVPEFSYVKPMCKPTVVPEQELDVIISEYLDDSTIIVLSDGFDGDECSFERIVNVKWEKEEEDE